MPEIAGVGIVSAFLAGIVSFLSPCVLPLVPGYVSYVAGQSLEDLIEDRSTADRMATLAMGLFFVTGFSAVFIALGASASAVGELLMAYRYEATWVAGAVIAVFGLHLMGILRLGFLQRDWRFAKAPPGGRPLGAALLGAAFAFGWTPCIGPILGAILTVSATTASVGAGAGLLLIYSMGLAIPFLLVTVFTHRFMGNMRFLRGIGRPLQAITGALLVLFGLALATGYVTMIGTWLLETFPFLVEIAA